jgi:IPT/TIG domain/Papain family cysteine protease
MAKRTRETLAVSTIVCIILLALCLSPALAVRSVAPAGQYAATGDGTHYLGLNRSDGVGFQKLTMSSSAMPLSLYVDLSAQLPPVGDQGQQGSCVAWASSYYYKSWSEKQEHSWDLNNAYYRYSPSFVYNQINGGRDNGSKFQDAFTLMQNKGDVDIAEMPYNQSNYTAKPTAAQLEAAKPYRIPGDWRYFWLRTGNGPFSSPNDISGVKTLLDSGKVLVMAIPVYGDFPNYGGNPSKAYYDYNGISSLKGGHGVCICGYDDNINPGGADTDHRGGFKMVNSWGPAWNGNGYVYLSYDFAKRYAWEAWAMSDLAPDDPAVASLSASSGNAGDSITISGRNFGTLRRGAKVSFNGVIASQVSFTDSTVIAQVPAGATTGPLTVIDWDGKASNSVTFTVAGSPPPAPCGQGAGAAVPLAGVLFGLMSVAGIGIRRRKNRGA